MTPYNDHRVREALNKAEWPEGVRIEYVYRPYAVVLRANQHNWKWLSPEKVMKTAEIIAEVLTYIRALGYDAYLEVSNDSDA